MIDWNKYAPEFQAHEFDCKHTGRNEMTVEFMDKLHALRLKVGKSFVINSGYRHWSHPEEMPKKGHKNGEHTTGNCADIACTDSSLRFSILREAFAMGFTRVGFHKRFIHLGIGGPGLPQNVCWDY